ncbi:MAG TPA: CBS and ACT domain-containing protein [Longimicrobiaceae bacterium]|nr:CBS and ACT domain-containing protein [Longimicrobiaceae bacterium]
MTRDPVTVGPDETLSHALRLTREHRIRHLPVVGGAGTLVGILSDRDIRLAMPSPLTVPDPERVGFLEQTPVSAVMTREVVTCAGSDPIEDAAKLLCRHRIGAVPVTDAAGRLQGILSETDILSAVVQILGGTEPASRLEVALADRPGELARAVAILAERAVNVVSVLVSPVRVQGDKTVIFHVGTIDPREVIGALEEAGFRVGWPSLEEDVRARLAE